VRHQGDLEKIIRHARMLSLIKYDGASNDIKYGPAREGTGNSLKCLRVKIEFLGPKLRELIFNIPGCEVVYQ